MKLIERLTASFAFAWLIVGQGFASNIHLLSVPDGYSTRSIELGVPFGGALAVDPFTSRVYVSIGSFGNQHVMAIEPGYQTTQTVTGSFGSIGGLACLADGSLVITENFSSDTIFLARDLNHNFNFLDPGEVTELIPPILTGGNFTGSQVAIAPPGNASGIPDQDVVIQTADGGTDSELLVIDNPTSAPVFRPAGGAYYSGFQYNGGVAFDNPGNIILGISQLNFSDFSSSGKIVALVNTNQDEVIGPGESHTLVDETFLNAGLTDLAVSKESRVFYGENSGAVKTFELPPNPLSDIPAFLPPAVFVQTDAAYISTVRIDRPQSSFAPGAHLNRATMFIGGLDGGFASATNLLAITPAPIFADVSLVKGVAGGFQNRNVGDDLTYNLSVSNDGPSTATNVTVTDTLPPGLIFEGATASQGRITITSGVVTVHVGVLPNDESATANIMVKLPEPGIISNQALAVGNETDVVPSNNISAATITVNPADCGDLSGSPNGTPTQRCFQRRNGMSCSVNAKLVISNVGLQASAPTSVDFYASDDATLDANDALIESFNIPAIQPSRMLRKTNYQLRAGSDLSGRFLIAVIDPGLKAGDCNRLNNVVVLPPVE